MSKAKVALFNKRTRQPLDGTALCNVHNVVDERRKIVRSLGRRGAPYQAEWRPLSVRLDLPCVLCACVVEVKATSPKAVVVEPPKRVVSKPVVLQPVVPKPVTPKPVVPMPVALKPVALKPVAPKLGSSKSEIKDPWENPPETPDAKITKTGGGNLKNGVGLDDLSELISKQRADAGAKKKAEAAEKDSKKDSEKKLEKKPSKKKANAKKAKKKSGGSSSKKS